MPRLSDIKHNQRPTAIEVRVLRKWIAYATDKDLCYLFVDKHGDAIEATANPKKEHALSSKIKIGSCYSIKGYVAIAARKSMRVVPHEASIRLGENATFEQVLDQSIPTYYYNFATYDMLNDRKVIMVDDRKITTKLLTGYIGRVEAVSPTLFRGGKNVKKVKIQDEWANVIEITFWSEALFPYERTQAIGQLLAITSTLVNTFQTNIQLESTDATTAILNPAIPELQSYINRFTHLPQSERLGQPQPILTIAEIRRKYTQGTTQTNFRCKAQITEIKSDTHWYYVRCPTCKEKLHLVEDPGPEFICEDHGYIPNPKLMYCVNTTITDESGSAKSILFNNAMTQMFGKSCYDMVLKEGNTDVETIPAEFTTIQGITTVFDISIKEAGTFVVNNAETHANLTPATPDPKPSTKKRTTHASSSSEYQTQPQH